jgi:uncharacterized protein (DUF58 family)
MDIPITGLSSVTPVLLADSPREADPGKAGHLLRFRRIYILPTRQGMGFAAAVSVMLLGSINYGNALGYVLSFMLIGASLVSMLHAVRNLAGLRVLRDESRAVFAGDTARFGLRLDNRDQRQRFGLLARFGSGRRRERENYPVLHFGLDADSVMRMELPGVTSRRGWCVPGPVTIATRFPFGLFRAWSRSDIGLRCLVYPRPAGAQALPACQPEESGEGGERGAGEDEFAGLRDYQQGDSARRVHWKAVAREQGFPVKVFSGAASGLTLLRWQDISHGDSEARLSQLCRWILDAKERNLRYGLCLPGLELAADSGDQHRRQCLEALALFDNGSQR